MAGSDYAVVGAGPWQATNARQGFAVGFAPGQQLPLELDLASAGAANDGDAAAKSVASPRRLGWANLLARVFAVDVTVCRKCGGRMRILDVVRDPDDIARLLHGARAPPRPPRPHPSGQALLFPC